MAPVSGVPSIQPVTDTNSVFPVIQSRPEEPTIGETVQNFGDLLARAIDNLNRTQQEADAISQSFAIGEERDITKLMITTERAHLTMQLAIQVRNKVLEAYQEIIRMPV